MPCCSCLELHGKKSTRTWATVPVRRWSAPDTSKADIKLVGGTAEGGK